MLTPHTSKSISQVFILLKIFVGDLERGADFCKDELEQFIEDSPVDAACRCELSHIQVPVQDVQESGVVLCSNTVFAETPLYISLKRCSSGDDIIQVASANTCAW
jgi:hypothetical protein